LCCAPTAPGAAPAAARRRARKTPVVRAYRRARPAVVNISARRTVRVRLAPFGPDPFDDIFPSPFSRRRQVRSVGTGTVVHPAGYIVTNAHVVRRAQQITAALADGQTYQAKVISADAAHDLAVLKVDPPEGNALAHLPLGRSDDLMVGETVIAIGNPLGYANSLTTGVISGVGRDLEFAGGVSIEGLIQTDAPINPGNSGGPLLNVNGEWIGINTAIRADAQNIGFAIPVDLVARELACLLDSERVNRVVFGAAVRQRHGEGGTEVVVASVRAGTPAAEALRDGDRILAINGSAVEQIADFACPMLEVRAGQPVYLKIARVDERRTVTVTPRARPKPDGKRLAEALFGLTLREITPALARDLRLPVQRGLLVVGIEAGSPADRLGVKLKDVLFQVDRYYVTDLDALGLVLEETRAGDALRLGIARGNVQAWATIRARKPPAAAPGGGGEAP
jgi:S1-C subfamily serine protease